MTAISPELVPGSGTESAEIAWRHEDGLAVDLGISNPAARVNHATRRSCDPPDAAAAAAAASQPDWL
jgi:hypothetical protein